MQNETDLRTLQAQPMHLRTDSKQLLQMHIAILISVQDKIESVLFRAERENGYKKLTEKRSFVRALLSTHITSRRCMYISAASLSMLTELCLPD